VNLDWTDMPIHEAIKADWKTPEILIEGSLGCAKTTVFLDKEIDALLKWPGIPILLFRWSQDAVDTKLRPAFEELLSIREVKSTWDEKKKRYVLDNGSMAYLFGLKSVSAIEQYNKIRGLGVSRIGGDQVEEAAQQVAAELRGRLVSIEDHVSRRFKPNEQMTHLLVGMIRSVAELFINSPPPNPQALATEIVSFIALTIGSEDRGAATDVRNARYHLRRRIVDFIETHLSDQSLSPKKIAASSRISLSYLYSLFNDNETTVSQFVQTKRLQRAYEILVADPKGHRTVSEVAYEVGFKNVSHFSRCFSRHFKVAPRDVRQTRDASPQPNTRSVAPKGLLAPRVPSPSRGGLASPYWERRPLHETV